MMVSLPSPTKKRYNRKLVWRYAGQVFIVVCAVILLRHYHIYYWHGIWVFILGTLYTQCEIGYRRAKFKRQMEDEFDTIITTLEQGQKQGGKMVSLEDMIDVLDDLNERMEQHLR